MDGDTKAQLLDVAERFTRTRGFNAFSYRDLAKEVGIRSASVHYHFPTKGDLGVALLQRYRARFSEQLHAIEAKSVDAIAALREFCMLFESNLKSCGLPCLSGLLMSEYSTLPLGMQAEVLEFYQDAERWLSGTLQRGLKAGALSFAGSSQDAAHALFSAVQGTMQIAAATKDPRRFSRACRWWLSTLGVERSEPRIH